MFCEKKFEDDDGAKRPFTHYCDDCYVFECLKCIKAHHGGCRTYHINLFTPKYLQRLNDHWEKKIESIPDWTEVQSQVKIHRQTRKVVNSIRKEFDDLIAAVEQRRDNLIAKAEEIGRLELNNIDTPMLTEIREAGDNFSASIVPTIVMKEVPLDTLAKILEKQRVVKSLFATSSRPRVFFPVFDIRKSNIIDEINRLWGKVERSDDPRRYVRSDKASQDAEMTSVEEDFPLKGDQSASNAQAGPPPVWSVKSYPQWKDKRYPPEHFSSESDSDSE